MATRQTFSISFYCRKSKADKKGLAPIEISIVINGDRTYLRLPRKERPDEFAKAINSKRENEMKVYCENQRVRLNSIVEDMQFADIEITAENLKECYRRGGVAKFYTLGELWQDIIANKMSEKATGDIQDDTFRRYKVARDAFYKATGYDKNTPAKKVELQDIFRLQQYLRDKGIKQNTIYQYHARCKSAFLLAFNRGKIKGNPYASFKMNKGEKKDIVWLTIEELHTLINKDINNERLARIRDLFIFQCFSGLSYGDMAELERSDYQENEQGQIFIEKHRKKTGKRFVSMVLKEGKRVLEEYDYQLPVLSNQKYNTYLKEIQDICGLDKELHTHLGRTTYICYLYQKKVDVEIIASIVGHSTCKTTLRYYAKMDNQTIFNELRSRNVANEREDENDNPSKTEKKDRPEPDPIAKAEAEKRREEKKNAILDTLRTTGIQLG